MCLQLLNVWSEVKWSEVKSLSRFWLFWLFATPGTVAHQAPLSMGFSRQEYWSGLPFPSPGDLPNPGIKRRSPTLQADTLTTEPPTYPSQNISKKLKCWNPLKVILWIHYSDTKNLRNTVKIKKRKLQTNFSDKYKYIDQNISKSNSTIYKGS